MSFLSNQSHGRNISIWFIIKIELFDLCADNLPSHLRTLPSFETLAKLVNLPNMNDFDFDDNIFNVVNSKYNNLDKILKKLISPVRSLSKQFDFFFTLSSVQ